MIFIYDNTIYKKRGILFSLSQIIIFQIVEIAGGGELMSSLKELNFLPGFALEGYPNRDSTMYADLYGIKSEVSTILRGTLRYKGIDFNTIQYLLSL